MEWISVNESLPDLFGLYLVYIKRFGMVGYQKIAFYDEEGFYLDTGTAYVLIYPTHWMTLPDPPKGD